MEITIDIVDRNYHQIKEFCDFNQIKIEDYIVQCVEDDFFIRKYGDLNEKFKQPKTEVEEKAVTENLKKEEEPKTEKKKVGRPKKKIEEPTQNENTDKEPKIDNKSVLIKKEEMIDTTDKQLQKTQTRIRRTLKTK